MDEQGDALRDASRTLFGLAESLEERGLRWRAESLRELAVDIRIDSQRQCKEGPPIGLCCGPKVTLDDWAEEFNERWERLPELLKPRKDSGFDTKRRRRGTTKNSASSTAARHRFTEEKDNPDNEFFQYQPKRRSTRQQALELRGFEDATPSP